MVADDTVDALTVKGGLGETVGFPMNVQHNLAWPDTWQRRHPVVGFPVAVLKRYGEDHGGWLGAIVTYYGFFALAPCWSWP